MGVREIIESKATLAREAGREIATLSSKVKNEALLKMAVSIEEQAEKIKEVNKRDLEEGEKKGLSSALMDRLLLNDKRIDGMAEGLRQVAALPDPVGEVVKMWKRPNNLLIGKMRVPLGVVAIIYESRPNVTIDTVALCLKSGNAVLLRGGSEAIHSNSVLVEIARKAAEASGVNKECIQFVDTPDRAAVGELLKRDDLIDLVVPRGGEGLIRFVAENSRIPVVFHYKGVCHTFVDRDADIEMARSICFNAKVQRPGVCNAMETMLVDAPIAREFLPQIASMLKEAGVELRGCPRTREILPEVKEATKEDWYEEYLDLILAIRVVDGMDEAIAHIHRYGSAPSPNSNPSVNLVEAFT